MNKKTARLLSNIIPLSYYRKTFRDYLVRTKTNLPKIQELDFKNPIIKSGEIKNVIILNETDIVNHNQHLGCHIVMKNISYLCKKNNLNIIQTYRRYGKISKKVLDKCQALIVNGEGSFHDDHGVEMLENIKRAKEAGKKVFLINAVWQNNDKITKYLKYCDLITVRESLSLKELQKDGADGLVVPDLSFYARKSLGIKPIKLNLENKVFIDNVIKTKREKLERISSEQNIPMLYMVGHNKLIDSIDTLKKYGVMISGRFHATCLSLILGIPTLSISSNTHKIEGMLKDANIDLKQYMCDLSAENYKEEINSFFINNHKDYVEKANKYTEQAVKKIDSLFTKIYKSI